MYTPLTETLYCWVEFDPFPDSEFAIFPNALNPTLEPVE